MTWNKWQKLCKEFLQLWLAILDNRRDMESIALAKYSPMFDFLPHFLPHSMAPSCWVHPVHSPELPFAQPVLLIQTFSEMDTEIFFFLVDFTFSLSGDTPVSLSPLHTLPPNICPWPSSLWHHYEVICPLSPNWISDLKPSNLSFVSSLSSDLMETGKTFNTFAMPTFYHKSFSRSFLSVLAQSRYHRCRGKAQTGVQGALL